MGYGKIWRALPLLAVLLMAAGCKQDAVRLSVEYLDFGDKDTVQRFELWNGSTDLSNMAVSVTPSAPWIVVDPADAESRSLLPDGTGEDKKTIKVTVDRTQLTGDRAEGSLVIDGPRIKKVTIPVYASPPYEAIGLSTRAVDFGPQDNSATVMLWNANSKVNSLLITATSDADWLRVKGGLLGVFLSGGPDDQKTVVMEVNRAKLAGGRYTGTVTFRTQQFAQKVVAVTVFQRYEAIGVSNESLDFGRDTRPWTIDVWNASAEFPTLGVQIQASNPWIVVEPAAVTSTAPKQGVADRRPVNVYIDRTMLDEGNHDGYLDLIPDQIDVLPVRVPVHVIEDNTTPATGLRIENVQYRYTAPYLLEFAFGLRDDEGNAVVEDPAAFGVKAFENGEEVLLGSEVLLKRGAARQLRAELVMDYSVFMQGQTGAIVAMEQAAREIFLPALNPEALVGITAFWRDDQAATRIADFTADKPALAGRIAAIQSEHVLGFYSGALALDALYDAISQFNQNDTLMEDRYVVFLSSGSFTPGQRSLNDVVSLAKTRRVRIHAIAFGENPDLATINDLVTRTSGRRYDAVRPEMLAAAFQGIINNLGGQYVLRWATLRRNDAAFAPSFQVSLADREATHVASVRYTPTSNAGDPAKGRIRLAPSAVADGHVSIAVWADYAPRAITKLRLEIRSPIPFTASLVDSTDDGILGGWTLTQETNPETGRTVVEATSPGDPIRFADFGPMLRLDWDTLPDEPVPLLEEFQVDNTLYEAGQSFEVMNFD